MQWFQWLVSFLLFIQGLFTPKPKLNKYGWKRGLPQDHEKKYLIVDRSAVLPAAVDHRPSCPPVYDQGNLGSCTANASGGAIEFEQIHHGMMHYPTSRLFTYWNTRSLEGTTNQDSGASIADTVKAIDLWGFCPESMWTYNINKFRQKPPKAVYSNAFQNQLSKVQYMSVAQDGYDMKHALANGNCIIIGFSVYDSFESAEVAKSGIVPMPKKGEQLLGGHAVLVVGYDDAKQWWIVRNSWGSGWGASGYFFMPYAYLTNPKLADDFWVIKTLTGAKK